MYVQNMFPNFLMIETLNLDIDLKLVRPVQAERLIWSVQRAEAELRLAGGYSEAHPPAPLRPGQACGAGKQAPGPAQPGSSVRGPAALTAWPLVGPQSRGGSVDWGCLWVAWLALAWAVVLGQLSRGAVLMTQADLCARHHVRPRAH